MASASRFGSAAWDERQWYGAAETVKPASVTGADHGVYRNWQIHQPLMADTIGTYEGELSRSRTVDYPASWSNRVSR